MCSGLLYRLTPWSSPTFTGGRERTKPSHCDFLSPNETSQEHSLAPKCSPQGFLPGSRWAGWATVPAHADLTDVLGHYKHTSSSHLACRQTWAGREPPREYRIRCALKNHVQHSQPSSLAMRQQECFHKGCLHSCVMGPRIIYKPKATVILSLQNGNIISAYLSKDRNVLGYLIHTNS